jgi:multidrug resistance efflux pump
VVKEVAVVANQLLKRGDVLFRIDARPYEFAVQQKRAALAEAEQTVRQLATDVARARAVLGEALANSDRTRQSFERYAEANDGARRAGRQGPYSELDIENRRQLFLANEAGELGARAGLERSELALGSQIEGVNTTVARLQAELGEAEWSLEQTTVRAPSDGPVSQLVLRPGMMAVPMPLRPVMVFIPAEQQYFMAAFQQNALQRVQPGDEAEIAFTALPGRIVHGRVRQVLDAMASGEVQPTGALIDPATRTRPGRVLAEIEILEDLRPDRLPGGVVGEVALYTKHWHHFAVIRRILLRMGSWQNYVFLEGH